MKKATVAVVRSHPTRVLKDYEMICDLAGIGSALDKSATTILKDNITWHYLFPGVNSTPWQLEGTILSLQKHGLTDIVDVHNNTVVTDPYKGEKLNKFTSVYEKYNIPCLYNFKKEDMSWVEYKPEHKMLALDKIFPEGIRIPDYFMGKNIVHLPTMKTHTYTTVTGAMKNAFGGLLNTKRHYTHTWIHDTLVDLLAIQKEIHTGLFAVMDGTTAGSGPGPRTIRPHEKSVLLASSDMVAIDAVAARIMGFDPMQIRCLAKAHELGLGVADPHEIEVLCEPEILNESWNFTVGSNFATGAGKIFWNSPLRMLQKLFFHTPLVNLFVFASAAYHDWFWYPAFGKMTVKAWDRNSMWGNLFRSY